MHWGCLGYNDDAGMLRMLRGCRNAQDASGMLWGCTGDALGHWGCLGYNADAGMLRMRWECFWDALGILLEYFRDALGCFGDALGMLWGCFRDALGMHWGCIGDALGMLWECSGDALGCIGDALGKLWGMFWDALRLLLVSIGDAVEIILRMLCGFQLTSCRILLNFMRYDLIEMTSCMTWMLLATWPQWLHIFVVTTELLLFKCCKIKKALKKIHQLGLIKVLNSKKLV